MHIQILQMGGDFSADFDGETARLCIQHVYPEDEGEYTCVAYNDLGKAFTSACLIVDGNFVFNSRSFNKAIWKRQVIQIRETFGLSVIQLPLYLQSKSCLEYSQILILLKFLAIRNTFATYVLEIRVRNMESCLFVSHFV